jgi:uncharacterized membrane protein HdeD (DUF308 family)
MSDDIEVPPPPRPAELEGIDRSQGTLLIVLGIGLVVVGLILLANPFSAIWILGVLVGVSFVLGGLAGLLSARQSGGPPWLSWLLGGACVALGIAAASWPDATVWVLAALGGIALVIAGASTIAATLLGASTSRGPGLALGVATLVIGVVVLSWPEATLLVIAVLIGLRTLLAGVLALGVGINVRRLG